SRRDRLRRPLHARRTRTLRFSQRQNLPRQKTMKPIKTNSLRAWIIAVRPYSFGAATIPVAAGTALAWHDGAFRWQPALLCLLFALLMQCVANLVNDLFDFLKGSDRPDRLGPDRAFAKGYITPP